MSDKSEMDVLLQKIEGEFIPNDFIAEVEARHVIWNHTDPLYTKQACKKAAWDSLIRTFHADIDSRSPAEQALISSHYRRKWKSFRDSFARELSKIKNSTKPRKTKYIYFQQLSFLLSMKGVPSSNIDDVESYMYDAKNDQYEDDDSNNIDNNNFSNSNDNTFNNSIDINNYSNSNDNSNFNNNNNKNYIKSEPDFSLFEIQQPDLTIKNLKTTPSSQLQQHTIKSKRRKCNSPGLSTSNMLEEDEDKLFLLSLLSELQRIPPFMKLDVKCDLLNVFKHARSQYMNNSDNNNNIENDVIPNNNIDNNAITNGHIANNNCENTNNCENNNNCDNINSCNNNNSCDNNNNTGDDNNNSYHAYNGFNNNNNNHNNIFNNVSSPDNDDFNANSHILNDNHINTNNFIHT